MKVFLEKNYKDWSNTVVSKISFDYFSSDSEVHDNIKEQYFNELKNCDYILCVAVPENFDTSLLDIITSKGFEFSERVIFCILKSIEGITLSYEDIKKFENIGKKIVKKGGRFFGTVDEAIIFLNTKHEVEKSKLNIDPDYLQNKYLIIKEQSIKWDNEKRPDKLLLVAEERIEAENWLGMIYSKTEKIIFPDELQIEYINRSKKYANKNLTDVFISYEDRNKEIAGKISFELSKSGVTYWTKDSDLDAGQNYSDLVFSAIEKAANLIYLVTSDLLKNSTYISELEYANKFNKRIFYIFLEQINKAEIPTGIQSFQIIEYFNKNNDTFNTLINRLIGLISEDKEYFQKHRDLLVKAQIWERKMRTPTMLLNGFDLELAEKWLKKHSRRTQFGVLDIHERYILQSEVSKPSVFISYGRKHSAIFASKLCDKLTDDGFNVWIDKNDIPLGVDFQEQIDKGIENADNFIFIISPHSIKSVYCQKELILALKYNKRIIPILHVEPTDCWDLMHPVIGKLNWIYSREKEDFSIQLNQWEQIDDFEKSYSGLLSLLEKHSEYLKQHTHILIKALKWERNQYSPKYLLSGQKRIKAENWLSIKFTHEQAPSFPTELHCAFIAESRKHANSGYTDAFISYATENRSMREKIDKALVSNGIATWVHSKDIKKGLDFEKSLKEGVEQTDSFIYFMSPDALASDYCNLELEYALQYNKNIILILVEPVDINLLNPKIRNIEYIDFTNLDENEPKNIDESKLTVTQRAEIDVKARKEKTKWEIAIELLVQQILRDKSYFQTHKELLIRGLKWKANENSNSFLLRGNDLYLAQAWLKIGNTREQNKPLPIHSELINASIEKEGVLFTELFICFSISDADFVRRLNENLQISGKITWIDQQIETQDKEQEEKLFKEIDSSIYFIFIISPESVNSDFCNKQFDYAKANNKRIIGIECTSILKSELPEKFTNEVIIDFTSSEFPSNYITLVKELDTDLDYLKANSRWAFNANQWVMKNKTNDLLLRGTELNEAKIWLDNSLAEKKMPAPSAIQIEFINKSEEFFNASLAKERQRKIMQRLMIAVILLCFGIIALGFIAREEHLVAQEQQRLTKELTVTLEKQKEIVKVLTKEIIVIDSVKSTNNALQDSIDAITTELALNANENTDKLELAKEYNQAAEYMLNLVEKVNNLKTEDKKVLVLQAQRWFNKAIELGYMDANIGLTRINTKTVFSESIND